MARTMGSKKNISIRPTSEDRFIGVWVKRHPRTLKNQVGRSEHNNLDLIAADIIDKLRITEYDKVLDVCCGNGLITKLISKKCKVIYAVDFSKILIATAKKDNNAQNIHYCLGDALNISKYFPKNFFDKSYCYFSFQHFDFERGPLLVDALQKVTKCECSILIGDIPDLSRIWSYYNTPLKKSIFLMDSVWHRVRRKGQCSLGWWWHPDQLKEICNKLNLNCVVLKQEKKLPHSYYRFDILIRR